MASIPVASYSAKKIREHMSSHGFESQKGEDTSRNFRQNTFGIEKSLQNYNSKLMNSIWGQYNLYASHAFQKNIEVARNAGAAFVVPQVKNLWDFPVAHCKK